MTKEALKLALEVLVCLKKDFDADQFEWEIADEAITAIKEALANDVLERKAENARELGLDYEPEQMHIEKNMTLACPSYLHDYTTPPQRTWTELTDEEVGDLSDFAYTNDEEFVRNVEKYLKEKNNG